MLKMATLESDQSQPGSCAASEAWGLRQQAILLGAALLVLSLAAAVYVVLNWPPPPAVETDREVIQQNAQQLSPLQSWLFWQTLHNLPLTQYSQRTEQLYADALLRSRLLLGAVLLGAGLGAGLVLLGIVRKPRRPRQA